MTTWKDAVFETEKYLSGYARILKKENYEHTHTSNAHIYFCVYMYACTHVYVLLTMRMKVVIK